MIKKPKRGDGRRDHWGTPHEIVAGIEAISNTVVVLDVCAEEWSAKAPTWLGPDGFFEDALDEASGWSQAAVVGAKHVRPEGRTIAAWMNPTFSFIDPWTAKALVSAPRLLTWALVPPRTERNWWRELVDAHDRAWLTHITGRIEFIPPAGISNDAGAMGGVVIWQIGGERPLLPEAINRGTLEAHGRAELERRNAA